MDRPAAWAATPPPTTISRAAARNSSRPGARATERNRGRSTSRPRMTISPTPRAAGPRVRRAVPMAAGCSPPSAVADRAASTVTVISSGATARSWASRIEKVARPAPAPMRFRSARTGSTMAVDDSARAMPATSAVSRVWPSSRNRADRAAVQARIWATPRPNTMRRMVFSRPHDSSSPIMNSRKATPSSASTAMSARSVMVSHSTQGATSANRPRPSGPSSTPAARKPSTGLTLNRLKMGTSTPAAARKTTRSLYSPACSAAIQPHLVRTTI